MVDGTDQKVPDWKHSGTGLVAIIYDTYQNDVKLAVFDKDTVRLLWCLKWTNFIKFQMSKSNSNKFYIIDTSEDYLEHVSLLYENKDAIGSDKDLAKLIMTSGWEDEGPSGGSLGGLP